MGIRDEPSTNPLPNLRKIRFRTPFRLSGASHHASLLAWGNQYSHQCILGDFCAKAHKRASSSTDSLGGCGGCKLGAPAPHPTIAPASPPPIEKDCSSRTFSLRDQGRILLRYPTSTAVINPDLPHSHKGNRQRETFAPRKYPKGFCDVVRLFIFFRTANRSPEG